MEHYGRPTKLVSTWRRAPSGELTRALTDADCADHPPLRARDYYAERANECGSATQTLGAGAERGADPPVGVGRAINWFEISDDEARWYQELAVLMDETTKL